MKRRGNKELFSNLLCLLNVAYDSSQLSFLFFVSVIGKDRPFVKKIYSCLIEVSPMLLALFTSKS